MRRALTPDYRAIIPGTKVRHREAGWEGVVSRFAHADGRMMILWPWGGSLWAYDELEIIEYPEDA